VAHRFKYRSLYSSPKPVIHSSYFFMLRSARPNVRYEVDKSILTTFSLKIRRKHIAEINWYSVPPILLKIILCEHVFFDQIPILIDLNRKFPSRFRFRLEGCLHSSFVALRKLIRSIWGEILHHLEDTSKIYISHINPFLFCDTVQHVEFNIKFIFHLFL